VLEFDRFAGDAPVPAAVGAAHAGDAQAGAAGDARVTAATADAPSAAEAGGEGVGARGLDGLTPDGGRWGSG
jgi:hypothetical protein